MSNVPKVNNHEEESEKEMTPKTQREVYMERKFYLIPLLILVVGCSAAQKTPKTGADTSTPAPFSSTLGLPPLEVPLNNPITKEKVALGEKLFHDKRFSTTGTVSCATCHAADKAFTDSPLRVSKGIHDLTGTRNAPTVLNSVMTFSKK